MKKLKIKDVGDIILFIGMLVCVVCMLIMIWDTDSMLYHEKAFITGLVLIFSGTLIRVFQLDIFK